MQHPPKISQKALEFSPGFFPLMVRHTVTGWISKRPHVLRNRSWARGCEKPKLAPLAGAFSNSGGDVSYLQMYCTIILFGAPN